MKPVFQRLRFGRRATVAEAPHAAPRARPQLQDGFTSAAPSRSLPPSPRLEAGLLPPMPQRRREAIDHLELTKRLECPVSLDPMTEAVLLPCGHDLQAQSWRAIAETTARREPLAQPACPTCTAEAPQSAAVPDPAMRAYAVAFSKAFAEGSQPDPEATRAFVASRGLPPNPDARRYSFLDARRPRTPAERAWERLGQAGQLAEVERMGEGLARGTSRGAAGRWLRERIREARDPQVRGLALAFLVQHDA
ncbi:MAG TPA: hypothetical protein VFH51_07485 [Myxococcota bacterium]|nr:hypothetical protein [Myxococcota bacterium]